jgi:hypothetical protein
MPKVPKFSIPNIQPAIRTPKIDDLVKSHRNDGFAKTSPAKAGQGAQKLRSEAHLQMDFLRDHQNWFYHRYQPSMIAAKMAVKPRKSILK